MGKKQMTVKKERGDVYDSWWVVIYENDDPIWSDGLFNSEDIEMQVALAKDRIKIAGLTGRSIGEV